MQHPVCQNGINILIYCTFSNLFLNSFSLSHFLFLLLFLSWGRFPLFSTWPWTCCRLRFPDLHFPNFSINYVWEMRRMQVRKIIRRLNYSKFEWIFSVLAHIVWNHFRSYFFIHKTVYIKTRTDVLIPRFLDFIGNGYCR